MKLLSVTSALALCFTSPALAQHREMLNEANKSGLMSPQDIDAIARTSDAIRAAYATGDVELIMSLHHPQVIKVIGFNNLLDGYEAVRKDLVTSLAAGSRQFVSQKIESIILDKGAAVQQADYSIRITPTDGRPPFITRGRSVVIYVPYAKSPTGWAIFRGFVQPGGIERTAD
jgi:ketosteroid isomerase-like protein